MVWWYTRAGWIGVLLLGLCVVTGTGVHAGANTTVQSFSKAKKLAAKVFADHPTTFYCGCRYAGTQIDLASCGFQIKHQPKRAKRLEWEHVVPGLAGQTPEQWYQAYVRQVEGLCGVQCE